jgi:hypothetical protein
MVYYRSELGCARDAKLDDIPLLKDHLRKTTVDELWALHHFTPEQSLLYSFSNSVFSFSIEIKEDVYAMGGILRPKDLLSERAPIWFLSSQKLDNVELRFLRQCRKFIHTMLDLYPVLYNYVDLRNGPAISWLEWMGAKFGDTVPFGIDNQLFTYFEFRRD